MNGYEYIKSLSVKKIAQALEIERGQAYFILQKGIEGIIKDPYVCPLAFPLPKKYKCAFHEEGCHECMRRFLTSEILMRYSMSHPCTFCIEWEFCRGNFPCRRYKEYMKGE